MQALEESLVLSYDLEAAETAIATVESNSDGSAINNELSALPSTCLLVPGNVPSKLEKDGGGGSFTRASESKDGNIGSHGPVVLEGSLTASEQRKEGSSTSTAFSDSSKVNA